MAAIPLAFIFSQDCTAAANPDGVSGREWCYVEDRLAFINLGPLHPSAGHHFRCETKPHSHSVRGLQEQAASAGEQKWDYCAPKINYADVRRRVEDSFGEKANEIAHAIDVVQSLSKEATRLCE